jgi:hypothetical protein
VQNKGKIHLWFLNLAGGIIFVHESVISQSMNFEDDYRRSLNLVSGLISDPKLGAESHLGSNGVPTL